MPIILFINFQSVRICHAFIKKFTDIYKSFVHVDKLLEIKSAVYNYICTEQICYNLYVTVKDMQLEDSSKFINCKFTNDTICETMADIQPEYENTKLINEQITNTIESFTFITNEQIHNCNDIAIEYLVNQFITYIIDNRLPFPYKKNEIIKMNNDVVISSLKYRKNLFSKLVNHNYSTFNIISNTIMHDKNEYAVNMLSDHYTENIRIKTSVGHRISTFDYWNLYQNEIIKQCTNTRELIWKTSHEATNFKISIAKVLYKHFKATCIFDPFAGWGDRLIGALACNDSDLIYKGIDINSALIDGYSRILEELAPNNNNCTVECADIFDYQIDCNPNFILASPPYFDYEIYDDVSLPYSDSCTKWVESWLYPVIMRLYCALIVGGHLLLYLNPISDDPNVDYTNMLLKLMPIVTSIINVDRPGKKKRNTLKLYVWKRT